jgi:hypothetical protein
MPDALLTQFVHIRGQKNLLGLSAIAGGVLQVPFEFV